MTTQTAITDENRVDLSRFSAQLIRDIKAYTRKNGWKPEATVLADEYCRILLARRDFKKLVIPPTMGSSIARQVEEMFVAKLLRFGNLPEGVMFGQTQSWFAPTRGRLAHTNKRAKRSGSQGPKASSQTRSKAPSQPVTTTKPRDMANVEVQADPEPCDNAVIPAPLGDRIKAALVDGGTKPTRHAKGKKGGAKQRHLTSVA